MAVQRDILTIETLEKFERVINRINTPFDINMMVMPGTLEDKHKNADHIPALRRQFHLLYLMTEGEHDVKLNSEHRFLRPNDLVIVPENTLYASDHIRGCKGYCIHFKTEYIQPLLHGTLHDAFPYFDLDAEHFINITDDESALVQQAFKDILAEHARFSYEKDFLLRNYIMILLHRVREIYKKHVRDLRQTTTRAEQIASRFRLLVESQFTENRSVTDYARQLNISPKHLTSVVRTATGRSPQEIILDLLFLEAKSLLRSTGKTATEIAFELGFEDQSHFSRFIKKRTGQTPLELRKHL